MLLATPFWSRTTFPRRPHLCNPRLIPTLTTPGLQISLPAEEWDYRVLHCNRLISTRPAFHPICFHLHPSCVSCPSCVNKFVQEKTRPAFGRKGKNEKERDRSAQDRFVEMSVQLLFPGIYNLHHTCVRARVCQCRKPGGLWNRDWCVHLETGV